MDFAQTPYPEPGELVQRFSWEVEARPDDEPGSAEFNQVREDFIVDQARRRGDKLAELDRIEENLMVRKLVNFTILPTSLATNSYRSTWQAQRHCAVSEDSPRVERSNEQVPRGSVKSL